MPFDDLPIDLVSAFEREEWTAVRDQLRTLMDGVTTDGPYGRQLIQLVRRLPLGVDALFDRYRAITAIDYGDWDDLKRSLDASPIEAIELEGIRDILLAPIDQTRAPNATAAHQAALFEVHEVVQQAATGRFKRWTQTMLRSQFNNVVWSREDLPATRHLRYRRLQDVVNLAIGEAVAGRLYVSAALAREAQRVGDDKEQLRIVAGDLESLVRLALADVHSIELKWLSRITSRTGFSPLGTWEILTHLLPLISLVSDGSFGWCVGVVERIAGRMGSPRAQLQAEGWQVASELLEGKSYERTELAGLLVQARPAAVGLRALPQLLDGYARPRHSAFSEALDLARQSGNVWIQVSALAWLTSLNSSPWTSRFLFRLLEVTGWRHLVLVPPAVAADAALALTAAGFRGRAIVELALTAGRQIATTEVACSHVDDEGAPLEARIAAVQALGKLGTSRSRETLERISRRRDELGLLARGLMSRPAPGVTLTEREIEVLGLAGRGLTNKEIGIQLGLSEHTVARHVANARSKLGAANRAEAVSRLAELSRS